MSALTRWQLRLNLFKHFSPNGFIHCFELTMERYFSLFLKHLDRKKLIINIKLLFKFFKRNIFVNISRLKGSIPSSQ